MYLSRLFLTVCAADIFDCRVSIAGYFSDSLGFVGASRFHI
jgi:hypothetical protein